MNNATLNHQTALETFTQYLDFSHSQSEALLSKSLTES